MTERPGTAFISVSGVGGAAFDGIFALELKALNARMPAPNPAAVLVNSLWSPKEERVFELRISMATSSGPAMEVLFDWVRATEGWAAPNQSFKCQFPAPNETELQNGLDGVLGARRLVPAGFANPRGSQSAVEQNNGNAGDREKAARSVLRFRGEGDC